ncbi:MAG: RNA polymerase sigma54 factor [Candidatus Campylobacter infans]|nr:MAG: RNA polymerase sigma54 factor [Candidatus Campylobacter infans]
MALTQKQNQKGRLNQTLRSWLPLLQISSAELRERINELLDDNPFATCEQKMPEDFNSYKDYSDARIYEPSLYESLFAQINAPLFKKGKEQDIANAIIECVSDEGYFEYDEKILSPFSLDEIENVRLKFRYLEPVGVGAKDYKQSFLWQLDELCENEISTNDENFNLDAYALARQIILDFENLSKYTKSSGYDGAIALIRRLKNPPAMDFMSADNAIAPDLFVSVQDGVINIQISDDFYPQITIDTEGLDEKMDFVATYVRQAKDLIDALEMRKSTLYKIGLMIIEYQYEYFFGGAIRPMRLKDIASDLGRNPSTISRAIANKYLLGPRGTVALKSFFATEAGADEISNAALREFIKELIKNEDHKKPLSDEAILGKIKERFGVELVRRTITKYRKILNIAGSSERKRLYDVSGV